MAERKIQFLNGEYYHIYNRGNSKQSIFHDTQDYERFVALLYLSNSDRNFKINLCNRKDLYNPENRGSQLVAIGAWTIMSNHFHILMTPIVDRGLSKYMQRLTTGYSMYYNQKYGRTGGLFEGKFKAVYVNEDRQLKYLFSYIHLNCLKLYNPNWKEMNIDTVEAFTFLEKYNNSSYLDYTGHRRAIGSIIDRTYFPDYFPTPDFIKNEILSWFKM